MKNKILLIINGEYIVLCKNLKKEIKYILLLSFKEYFKELIFPKDMNFFLIFLRIITLYILLRFFFDVLFFIFKVSFNFYFIILKLNFLFFGNFFFFKFNLKFIKFFKYLIFFMFFVNILEDIKKKKIPL